MKSIGWISLNKEFEPLRKPRSGYGWRTQDQKGYHPPRIYQKKEMAMKQSPVGMAKEVFIND